MIRNGSRLVCGLLLCVMASVSFAGNALNGKPLFMKHCAQCHGQTGEGTLPGAPPFKGNPDLLKSNAKLIQRIEQGKGICPSYLGLLKDEQLEDIAAYVRMLQ